MAALVALLVGMLSLPAPLQAQAPLNEQLITHVDLLSDYAPQLNLHTLSLQIEARATGERRIFLPTDATQVTVRRVSAPSSGSSPRALEQGALILPVAPGMNRYIVRWQAPATRNWPIRRAPRVELDGRASSLFWRVMSDESVFQLAFFGAALRPSTHGVRVMVLLLLTLFAAVSLKHPLLRWRHYLALLVVSLLSHQPVLCFTLLIAWLWSWSVGWHPVMLHPLKRRFIQLGLLAGSVAVAVICIPRMHLVTFVLWQDLDPELLNATWYQATSADGVLDGVMELVVPWYLGTLAMIAAALVFLVEARRWLTWMWDGFEGAASVASQRYVSRVVTRRDDEQSASIGGLLEEDDDEPRSG